MKHLNLNRVTQNLMKFLTRLMDTANMVCYPRESYCQFITVGNVSESSFAVIHKVGNFGIFVLLKFENASDEEINYFNFNSKYLDKTPSALNCFQFIFIFSCTEMSPLPTVYIMEKLE